jgi:Carboxypeptidase regulatory-like domain
VKRLFAALLAIAIVMPVSAAAQNVLTIAYGKTIDVPVAGATAAYPVNPTIAQAGIVDGAVEVRGIGAGTTSIIVVTPAGSQTLDVTVSAPQLAIALGIDPNGGPEDANAIAGGSYEGSYDTGAGQVTNSIEMHDRQGDSFRRFQLITATYTTPGTTQTTGIPLISYEVGGPGHDIIFLDDVVTMSPLTFENALIRGIHVSEGPWIFHAGASSIAQFDTLFIPTDPQWTAGVSRIFKLTQTSDLQANFYDIVNAANTQTTVNGGLLGSLLYTYHPQPHFIVQAEVGVSHGVGFDASTTYDDTKQHLDASFVDKPPTYASLASNAQQGLFANVNYDRTFSAALNFNGALQQSNYDLPEFREDSLTTQGNFNYRLNKVFTLNGGMQYSAFDSISPTSFNARTLSAPVGIQYAAGHYTAGLSYQPTTDFSGTLANGYGANAGIAFGPFSASGFFNHNVDIPTISSIFDQAPGLQQALQQAGIDITNPAQLAAVLNNAALLASLGFAGLKFDVAPARNDIGFNAAWSGAQRRQLITLNYLSSSAQLTQGSFDFRLATLNYLRKLGSDTEVEASVSLLKTTETTGSTTNVAGSTNATNQPSYGLTIRHRFAGVPDLLFPTKRGSIDGYVFRDDDSAGRYASGDPGLAGVVVTLDSEHTTRTDSSGHYTFAGIPFGEHVVAAQVKSDKPFYFTTASPANATIGSTVNFGVNYVSGKIFGYVTNDAGAGVAGVVLLVQGLSQTATTGADGRFVLDGVPQGHYKVEASADSLPTGYDLSNVTPINVDVTANAPWPVAISARALRSVSGTVMRLDAKTAHLVPVAGIDVSIPRLKLTVTTDENGAYALRDLPAGTFDVQVDGGNAGERRSVTLPPDPTSLIGIDFRVTLDQIKPHPRARRASRLKATRRVGRIL